jgi:hypothetical protein
MVHLVSVGAESFAHVATTHQPGFADELRNAAALALGRLLDQLYSVAGEADRVRVMAMAKT